MFIVLHVPALGQQTRINVALLGSYSPLIRNKHGEDVVCGSLLILDGQQVRVQETVEEIDKLMPGHSPVPVAKPAQRIAS